MRMPATRSPWPARRSRGSICRWSADAAAPRPPHARRTAGHPCRRPHAGDRSAGAAGHPRSQRIDLALRARMRGGELGLLPVDLRLECAVRAPAMPTRAPSPSTRPEASRMPAATPGRRCALSESGRRGPVGCRCRLFRTILKLMSISDPKSSKPKPARANRNAGPQAPMEALLADVAFDPLRRALWLDALDQRLRPSLPPALAPHARVANVDGGRLVYVVDAPVWRADCGSSHRTSSTRPDPSGSA